MASQLFVIPNLRYKTTSIKESSGEEFLCPNGTVMTGRCHSGDEKWLYTI